MLYALFIGLVAGWLANYLYKGKGKGLFINLGVGLVGSFFGSFVFGLLGLNATGFIGSIVSALAGSILLLFVLSKLK